MKGEQLEKPGVGSPWIHTNGNRYTVLMLTNEHTEHPDRYPVTVVYKGENGRIWSKSLADWYQSMTPELSQG